MEDNQVAADLRARLAETIGQERYELWFGSQTQFRLTDGCLTVVAASKFTRDWLRRNFAEGVRAVCARGDGRRSACRIRRRRVDFTGKANTRSESADPESCDANQSQRQPTHSDSAAKAAQLATVHANGADSIAHRSAASSQASRPWRSWSSEPATNTRSGRPKSRRTVCSRRRR